MSGNGALSLLRDRAVGALLGAAIGDALGWPQEQNGRRVGGAKTATVQAKFQPWKRREGSRYYTYEETIQPGEYSDDTQLMVATARSLITGSDWNRHLSRSELPLWLLYERGGGGATKRAAECWLSGKPPWAHPAFRKRYFEAGGNGVAMRIAPHVFRAVESPAVCLRQVLLDGLLTHGHPRALLGALVYAHALWLASRTEGTLEYGQLIDQLIQQRETWSTLPTAERGFPADWNIQAEVQYPGSYPKIWEGTVHEILDGLQVVKSAMHKGALALDHDVLEQMGAFDPKTNGAGTVSALAAIYLASRYAADPTTGLLEAAFAPKTDTDTYASMVGGLIGALRGTDWILPEWKQVQDYTYIGKLAVSLLEMQPKEQEPPIWDKNASEYLQSLMEQGHIEGAVLGPLGTIVQAEKVEHQTTSVTAKALTWRATMSSGQTIFLTRIRRSIDKEIVQPPSAKGTGTLQYSHSRMADEPGATSPLGSEISVSATPEGKLLTLLEELSRSFPPQIPASAAFGALSSILLQLDYVRKAIDEKMPLDLVSRDVFVLNILQKDSRLGRTLSIREFKSIATRLIEYLDQP